MKVIESYWKDTVAVCHNTNSSIINVSNFLTFLQVVMQFLFDQTKEREKCFGFITKTFFIFVALCI
jgi:hypothetical protein